MKKRVYTLYRVSTIGQVEKDDIPMQKEACHEFAERQGWEIVKEFSEKGVSGFKKSAKEMIVDELMKNAKILLANSKMSIKDIALDLNFLQETNFTAFFKKNSGISPTKFRQNTPN